MTGKSLNYFKYKHIVISLVSTLVFEAYFEIVLSYSCLKIQCIKKTLILNRPYRIYIIHSRTSCVIQQMQDSTFAGFEIYYQGVKLKAIFIIIIPLFHSMAVGGGPFTQAAVPCQNLTTIMSKISCMRRQRRRKWHHQPKNAMGQQAAIHSG